DDRFVERFIAERAVMAELRPFIPARELDLLETGAERIAGLHLALDRRGGRARRRGVSQGARALVRADRTRRGICAAGRPLRRRPTDSGSADRAGHDVLAGLLTSRHAASPFRSPSLPGP